MPCLFVPPHSGPFRQVLVALDGTERGMVVLRGALGFALGAGASLRMMTVDAGDRPELGPTLLAARRARLESELQALLTRQPMAGAVPAVEVRRGAIVEQILAMVQAIGADVLVIGYHRGGLPGIIEAGSTARHIVHTAPGAVLTIPL
jgi:nucleotide-binding universal stress UspA family protein